MQCLLTDGAYIVMLQHSEKSSRKMKFSHPIIFSLFSPVASKASEDTEAVKTATYYSLGDRYTFTPIRYHFPWKTSVLHLVTRFFDHVNNFPTNENNRGRPANKQSKAHPWASFIINRIPNCLSISGIKLKYLSIFLLDQSEKEKTVTWLFRRTLAQCAMAYVLVWQWYW